QSAIPNWSHLSTRGSSTSKPITLSGTQLERNHYGKLSEPVSTLAPVRARLRAAAGRRGGDAVFQLGLRLDGGGAGADGGGRVVDLDPARRDGPHRAAHLAAVYRRDRPRYGRCRCG